MRDGCTELDVTHALSAHDRSGDLDTTLVTNDTLVTDAFILAAITLVVLFWAENLLVEEPMLFRTLRAVVDGFRFGYLARRPCENPLGGRERETQPIPSVAGGKFAGSECHSSRGE